MMIQIQDLQFLKKLLKDQERINKEDKVIVE
jgi:hypothetical protein